MTDRPTEEGEIQPGGEDDEVPPTNARPGPRPRVSYAVGEVVRILEGPFVGFTGVVEEVDRERQRLRVAVMVYGRATPQELEFSQVGKA